MVPVTKAGDARGAGVIPAEFSKPAPALHAPRHLRLFVLSSTTVAFLIEVCARSIDDSTAATTITVESMGMLALLLLCGSALYLILRFGETPLLKWGIALATACLLASQGINIIEDIPIVAATSSLAADAPWHGALKNFSLLGGIVLMLATFYLALLETVAVRGALLRERNELYREIAERKEAQAALDESRNRLRRLSAHLEQVREDERAHVAREVHDELGQTLTSLKIDLANLRRRIEGAPQADGCLEVISSMSDQVAATVQAVRRIITELRPGILDDLGLPAAVQWLARDFEKRTGIACRPVVDDGEILLDRDRSTAVFRVLQETLTNVARHAQATRVEVRLAVDDRSVRLEVADNGRGISGNPLEEERNFGLLGIRERTAQFGGELQIHSSPGQGTCVIVALPAAK